MSNKFFKLGPPPFYLVTQDADEFSNLYLALTYEYPHSVIRNIRGKKCPTIERFFDEVAAALQFPYYFGENGGAFNDCLLDLDWLAGDAYLIMIDDAHLLMRDAPDGHFRGLLQIMADANREWMDPNQYIPRDRQPTPFHILFRCPQPHVEIFKKRLGNLVTGLEIIEYQINSESKQQS